MVKRHAFSDIINNSMERSPSSEADSHSLGQEIPTFLNPNVRYCVHKSPSLVIT